MAVTDTNFSAAVDAWCKKSEARMTNVFRQSVHDVVNHMTTPVGQGGNLPLDTGFLRTSVVVTTEGPAPIRDGFVPEKGKTYVPDGAMQLVIAALTIGQQMWACFTAAYAARQEYGFKGKDSLGREYNQAGRGFVRLAAQAWQSIVDRNVALAKEEAGEVD